MDKKALNRKVYIVCGSFLTILLIFFASVTINKIRYEIHLLSDGIRTEAQVIKKYHLKTKTGKIKKSYIEYAVFEDTTTVSKKQHKEINKNPKNIHDKIDNLFENFGSKNTPIGDYKTVKISVSLERFGATKIGDWKTFVYLKNEVEKGIPLEILE